MGPCRQRATRLALALAPLVAALTGAPAPAQGPGDNPVYVDDSPAAHEALVRAQELARVGNLDEAARVIQHVLDGSSGALVPSPEIEGVFVTARTRANAVLTAEPELLDHYRDLMTPDARALLETGQTNEVERSLLLTTPGYEAALRIAQHRFETGAFWSAWRTLAQLSTHPDHTGAQAAQALELLAQIAPFLAGDPHGAGAFPEVLETLTSWGGAFDGAIDWPEGARVRDPMHPGPALSVDSLLDRPLASSDMGATLASMQEEARTDDDTLIAWPTIVGSTVLINNGATISAWNRYSLSRLWRVNIDTPDVSFGSLGINGRPGEPALVASDGAVAVAVTGALHRGTNTDERVAVALDVRTGRVKWTRMASDLDGSLTNLLFGSRALVGEGVALIPGSIADSTRRLLGEYLVALDATNGRIAWTQALGSMGASGRNDYPRTAPTLSAGVVYFSHSIGVSGAIEAANGRVLWVRTEPSETQDRPIRPWEVSAPVFHEGRLFTLSPARRRVHELDPATGAVIASRSLNALLDVRYLVAIADTLALVTANEVYGLSTNDLAGNPFRIAKPEFLRGRVVAQGDRLLIPDPEGGWLAEPVSDGLLAADRFDLEHSGNLIATADQVLAVDDHEVHSYLLWEEAQRILLDLIDEDPTDPSPAITYAELAFRAGRLDPVLDSFDRALDAIGRASAGASRSASRERLYNVLREIVDPSVPRLTGATPDLLAGLTERLGRVAVTPAERVGYLLAAGWQASLTGRPEEAVGHYQEVLEDPELRRALYRGRSAGLAPAELEATQRLRRVVIEHGASLYQSFADDAQETLDLAQGSSRPEPYEDVARAYPLAPAAVDAWVEASDLYAQGQRPQRAILAARQGVETARGVIDPTHPALGRAVGRLIERLMEQGRYRAARDALARATDEAPGLQLEIEGQIVDFTSLSARLDELRSLSSRRPRIGTRIVDAFPIEGWIASPPIERSSSTPHDRVIVRSVAGDVAMALVGGERGTLWELKQLHAEVIAIDDRAVFLGVNEADNRPHEPVRQVQAVDADTGATLWTTPPFYGPDMFQEPTRKGFQPLIPLRGRVPPDEITVLIDETTLIMLDRVGNAAGFDVATGVTLWKKHLRLEHVYDSWLGAGMLAVGGRTVPDGPEQDLFEVVLFEARTGDTIVRHAEPREITWLRISPEGDIVVGLAGDVIKLDPFRGEVSWRTVKQAAIGSLNGWTVGDRLIIRDGENKLHSIDMATGADIFPISPPDVLEPGFSRMRLRDLGGGLLGIATGHGVAIIDREGEVIGRDAPIRSTEVFPAAFGEKHVVTLEMHGTSALGSNTDTYRLAIYELPSLRTVGERDIELVVPPDEVMVLDGRIVIAASPITVVLEAPVE